MKNLIAFIVLTVSLQAQSEDPFTQCANCHSFKKGAHGLGPSLYKSWGRVAGTKKGFRYSSAMKNSKIKWDEKSLENYIKAPQGFIPGNRMPFAGIEDASLRKKIIEVIKNKGQ